MKKNKLFLLLPLLFINNVYADDFCNDSGVLKLMRMIGISIKIIKILIPVILIIVNSISIFKILYENGSVKDKIYKEISRIFIAVFIFFIPQVCHVIFSLISDYSSTINNYTLCEYCLNNNELCSKSISKIENEENQNYADELNYINEFKENYEAKLLELINSETKKYSESSTFIGQKYDLTETELRHIAYKCQREQGQAKGSAAEASLMANRFELRLNTAKKYDNLYDFVKYGGWWSSSKKVMTGSVPNLKEDNLEAVRQVLIYGNRTLPLYVTEHDCWNCNSSKCKNGNRGDICTITINGSVTSSMSSIKDRNNYVAYDTRITSKYGGSYTFYSFPASYSDPFGFTWTNYSKVEEMQN